MDESMKNKLIVILEKKIYKKDPSHDVDHTLRVIHLAEKIAINEGGDLDVIIPSAIFHDIINYPKNSIKRFQSSDESAILAMGILNEIESFPKTKINKIYESIKMCSFAKNLKPDFLEAKILQDADGLESIGAIAIMRTFSSGGILNKKLYNSQDPFCKKRLPDDQQYALDLFFTRLLLIKNRLHTKTAQKMAEQRLIFLKEFLKELEIELKQIKPD